MSWTEAIKEFAKTSGKFSIPKKDSPEYVKIKAIQERLKKEGSAPVVVVQQSKKARVPKKAKVENVLVQEVPVVVVQQSKKARVPKKAKVENVLVQEVVVETPIVVKTPKISRVKKVKIENTEIDTNDEPEFIQPVKKIRVPRKVKVENVIETKKVQSHKGSELIDRSVTIVETPVLLTFN